MLEDSTDEHDQEHGRQIVQHAHMHVQQLWDVNGWSDMWASGIPAALRAAPLDAICQSIKRSFGKKSWSCGYQWNHIMLNLSHTVPTGCNACFDYNDAADWTDLPATCICTYLEECSPSLTSHHHLQWLYNIYTTLTLLVLLSTVHRLNKVCLCVQQV